MSQAGALILILGSVFVLLAAIGVVRFPDVYCRMQASTKASTLGIGFLMLGVGLHIRTVEAASRGALIVFFVFLTAPLAAHVLSRAALRSGIPLWKGTKLDEWSDSEQAR